MYNTTRRTGSFAAEAFELLLDLLHEQMDLFKAEAERANKLISVGDRKRDESLDPIELAAITSVAQTIMNLDGLENLLMKLLATLHLFWSKPYAEILGAHCRV